MSKPLRILHLEDDSDYSKLIRDLLAKEGIEAEIELVADRAVYEAALAQEKFDVILADFSLPSWNGVQALEIARAKSPHTPFLLVSGTIGEQAAIDGLRAGATDYVLKQWPERLVPAVRRAVQEAEERASRQHAETELIRRERYFRALTENSLDILSILNREGVFQYNSTSVKRVLGYDAQALVGQNVFTLVHPEDLPKVLQAFQYGLLHPDVPVTQEFRFRHRDGSWVYLETVGQNRLDDPDIAAVVVNSRDITKRKRAEAHLRLQGAALESTANVIVITDRDGKIFWANQAFTRATGYTLAEALDQNPRLLKSGQHDQAFYKNLWDTILAGRVWHAEMVNRRKDGGFYTEDCTITPLRSEEGEITHFIAVKQDITERKCLEEQLRQVQKMEAIGQLAGGVAHDFNNILTVIHGHASLLIASDKLNEPGTKSAQQIVQAAERAAGLTRQLLTFSRRQVMQPRRLDMNEVVGNMTKMLGRILGEDISPQLHYWPQAAPVNADASMIEQVLLNLAVNARDAMPKGGKLNIGVSVVPVNAQQAQQRPEIRPGQYVCLATSDTGCGIPPEVLRRIFEPFFTTKEVGKGTGLGLATVYGIVKQHQGWVEVESEVGKGTTFRVYIPCAPAAAEKSEGKPPEVLVRGGSETILVVEDEQLVRELVGSVLQGYGYTVLQAESGPKALEVWRRHKGRIHLLLTDLVMPDRMNGWELAEILWADRSELKVIFTSGYGADVAGKEFVMHVGANFLQKPYEPQKLALAVRNCLEAVEPTAGV